MSRRCRRLVGRQGRHTDSGMTTTDCQIHRDQLRVSLAIHRFLSQIVVEGATFL